MNMDIDTKTNRWLMELGHLEIPKSWYEQRTGKKFAVYKDKDRSGKKFDWNPIKRGTARLIKVIKIILTSCNGKMTAERAYEIVLSRKINLLPMNIYGRHMGSARFNHYYHKTRAEMGLAESRAFKTNFIKENKDKFSISEMAIYLGTTETYVNQIIYKIKRGLIK